jgi:hypothetical protein
MLCVSNQGERACLWGTTQKQIVVVVVGGGARHLHSTQHAAARGVAVVCSLKRSFDRKRAMLRALVTVRGGKQVARNARSARQKKQQRLSAQMF